VLIARSSRRLKFKAIEVAAIEFERAAVFDTGAVFEIFTEAIILRKVSKDGHRDSCYFERSYMNMKRSDVRKI
jgi:hypothetical protein